MDFIAHEPESHGFNPWMNDMAFGSGFRPAKPCIKWCRGFYPRGSTSYFLLPTSNFFLLIDAFHVKYIPGVGLKNQEAIIKGDQKSISIAAASILAKVYRDSLMKKLAKKYKKYHWEKNKGYGTRKHIEAIRRFGPTSWHRNAFIRKYLVYPSYAGLY